jgi:hypothetical protein
MIRRCGSSWGCNYRNVVNFIGRPLRKMIFGQTSDFAIEAYHEPSGAQYGGYGRMCIYIQGTVIGDLRENHCSLFYVVNRLRELLNGVETLWDERFATWSDTEIFNALDRALYKDHGQSLEYMQADWRRLSQYVFLTNAGEGFDDCNSFIICRPDGFVHVLYQLFKLRGPYQHLQNDAFGSASCKVESFRTVTKAFVHWFDEQVRTTAPPFFPVNPFNPDEYVSDNQKT